MGISMRRLKRKIKSLKVTNKSLQQDRDKYQELEAQLSETLNLNELPTPEEILHYINIRNIAEPGFKEQVQTTIKDFKEKMEAIDNANSK